MSAGGDGLVERAGISGTPTSRSPSTVAAGSLNVGSSAATAPQMRDPDGAVDRRAQDRAVAPRDDRPRAAPRYRFLRMCVVQVHALAQHVVEHAGGAIGRADLAQHGCGIVARQSIALVGLAQQRALPAADRGIGAVERLGRLAASHALQRASAIAATAASVTSLR